MRRLLALLVFSLMLACTGNKPAPIYKSVTIENVFTDSVSIRAITFLDRQTLAFAGNKGIYGSVDLKTGKVRTNTIRLDTLTPHFRAVARTARDFFMLSVASPALLYKTGEAGKMELVYKETGEGVFYDAMTFFNETEGIGVGDSNSGCLSIIITQDGGQTWKKIPCHQLPEAMPGEGAFAASNTNIEVIGDKIWIATTAGRIYFSAHKGKDWKIITTPMKSDSATQGIYSIDFYDENNGFAIGGDYTKPLENTQNKMRTYDGGTTWKLMANGKAPGYKSCVQFVPNSQGEALVAVGFTGISYSSDGGSNWSTLSNEGFYTLQFLNDTVAYAAGKHRIARLTFR